MSTKIEGVLRPVRQQGSLPPFFWMHGIFGDALSLSSLGKLLDPELPLYVFNAIGLHGDHEPDKTIEEMAERYVDALQQVEPNGPYYLGGYCFGGQIAYEMARVLEKQGKKTAFIAIVDGAAPDSYHTGLSMVDPQRIRHIMETAPALPSAYKEFGGWNVRSRLGKRFGLSSKNKAGSGTKKSNQRAKPSARAAEGGETQYSDRYRRIRHTFFKAASPEAQERLEAASRRALDIYEPQQYGGTVSLFRVRFLHMSSVFSNSVDPTWGWSRVAQDVDVYYIDGTHRTCLLEPHVEDLGSQMNAALREARQAVQVGR